MSRKLSRARKAEVVGTGIFVFGRDKASGRIHPSPFPFEHADLEAAKREAGRLALEYPGRLFEVYSRSSAAIVFDGGTEQAEAA